jgi:tRNA threonylcarbamoyladenosine modification (KEOPS) complex Cgi121 subunit
MLYGCAQKQIRVALDLIGIKQESSQVATLIVTDEKEAAGKAFEEISRLVRGEHDDLVLELSDEKMVCIRELFGISDLELTTKLEDNGEKNALSNLVIEHVALLVTQR